MDILVDLRGWLGTNKSDGEMALKHDGGDKEKLVDLRMILNEFDRLNMRRV